MPLVDLSMVEQRNDAVREVLDGATVKATATRSGSTDEPFTAGSCATRPRDWGRWPTTAPSRIGARIR